MKNRTYKNFTIHEFDELESTNSQAFSLANLRQISDREIILARKQSGGRGRNGRVWNSPEGNLYFSLALFPKIKAEKVAQISFVAIVALHAAVSKIVPSKVEVKWPNDLLIDEKKVSGLLLESKFNQNDCEFVIVGIGVNTASKPENVIFPAASLRDFGVEISPQILLENFLNEFEKFYQIWQDFGFEKIRKSWLENAFRFKQEIVVKVDKSELRGIFENFDSEGNLILKCAEDLIKISAADVFGG
jgi:BirA family transcriptional regulator, biotin operon repressor / biotin---[acetyl-CoA-carboxylase] ligase